MLYIWSRMYMSVLLQVARGVWMMWVTTGNRRQSTAIDQWQRRFRYVMQKHFTRSAIIYAIKPRHTSVGLYLLYFFIFFCFVCFLFQFVAVELILWAKWQMIVALVTLNAVINTLIIYYSFGSEKWTHANWCAAIHLMRSLFSGQNT